mgnify:CR=1 FL=1|jgi:diacylglycerol kinase (ATP)
MNGNSSNNQDPLSLPLLLLMLDELVNSSIEAVVDRFGGDLHERPGRAKAMNSAVVFMAIMITCLSWAIILCSIYL